MNGSLSTTRASSMRDLITLVSKLSYSLNRLVSLFIMQQWMEFEGYIQCEWSTFWISTVWQGKTGILMILVFLVINLSHILLYKFCLSILRLIEWLWYPISTCHMGFAYHQAVLKYNIDYKLFTQITGLYEFFLLSI